jgi:hypothetical protein
MTQKLEQGSIAFIDVPTRIPDLSPSKGITLLPLLDMIRDSIERIRGATPPLLIFDELACFEWIGHSSLDVSRFVRALVACCAKASMERLFLPCCFYPNSSQYTEWRFTSRTIPHCYTRRPRQCLENTSPALRIPHRSAPPLQREERGG